MRMINSNHQDPKSSVEPSSSQLTDYVDGPKIVPVISLFAGAGGLDLGFNQQGFNAVLALDSDEAAVDSYNHNHPGLRAVQCNLRKLTGEKLLNLLEEKAPG